MAIRRHLLMPVRFAGGGQRDNPMGNGFQRLSAESRYVAKFLL
jgi:hypothetical protein